MARYVPDILSHRWVIISPQRLKRPKDAARTSAKSKKKHHESIFCVGSEDKTPPEVLRYGGGEANKPGWKLRVIPNKYPITDFHEVVIHSPECFIDLEDLPLSQVELVVKAYHDRYNYYRKKGQVLIFANHGEHAGASIDHPHSQIVVLPFQINIDTLTREPMANMVSESEHYVRYCPDFSQWPYELWIAPKAEHGVFGDISDEEIHSLAKLLQKSLKQLKKIYQKNTPQIQPFGYNYYIYPKENWYVRIIPRFVNRAGFELGTGLHVNLVDPQQAAEEYKGGK